MLERRVGGKQLPVFLFSLRQLLGEKSQGSPGTIQELLQNRTHAGVRGINCQRDLSTRTRMNKLMDSGQEILGMAEGRV